MPAFISQWDIYGSKDIDNTRNITSILSDSTFPTTTLKALSSH
jgi:hypothetical protein